MSWSANHGWISKPNHAYIKQGDKPLGILLIYALCIHKSQGLYINYKIYIKTWVILTPKLTQGTPPQHAPNTKIVTFPRVNLLAL